jgi:transposase-like protein
VHGNARLTPRGRLTLVLRIASGPPVAHVAAEMGISRPTAYKWWHSFRTEGAAGLVDRSSRPHTCPHRTPPAIEARVIELRQATKLGPARYQLRPQGPGAPEHSPQKIHRVCRLIARRRPREGVWSQRSINPAKYAAAQSFPGGSAQGARSPPWLRSLLN